MAHTIQRLGRGSDAQLGFSVEGTYGTGVVPVTFFPEYTTFSLEPTNTIIEPASWRPGRRAKRNDMRAVLNDGGTGSFEVEVPRNQATHNGMLKLWRWMFGGTPTVVQQGGTTAYLATFQPGDVTAAGTSLTLQEGVPEFSGVVQPITLYGTKCAGATITADPGGNLRASFDINAQTWNESDDLATPAYDTGLVPWTWSSAFSVSRAGVVLPGVKSFSIGFTRGLNTDRGRLADGTGKRAQPYETDLIACTIDLSVEWTDITKTWDDLSSDTGNAYVITFTGPQISGLYYYVWRFTMQETHLLGDPPDVTAPTEVLQSVKLEALDDGTNPVCKLEVISTDTAV